MLARESAAVISSGCESSEVKRERLTAEIVLYDGRPQETAGNDLLFHALNNERPPEPVQRWPVNRGGAVGDSWEFGVALILVITAVFVALWITDDGEHHHPCRADDDWCHGDYHQLFRVPKPSGIAVLRW